MNAKHPVIVQTRRLFPESERILDSAFQVIRPRGRAMSRREILARIGEADGLLCQLTDKIDKIVLDRAERLRAVSVCAVGYENVDTATCAERGIAVANTPGVLTEACADHAWALLLSAARRVVEADKVCRRGKFPAWDLEYMLGKQVHGAVLGVLGLGRIGQAVARRALGFGMRILHFSVPPPGPFRGPDTVLRGKVRAVDLDRLLRESDFLTIHVPGGDATRHLIGERELALMKKDAILVNSARGTVVDSAALARALSSGRLAAAGLDVFEGEPIVPAGLRRLPNCVMTPHVASATCATRHAMARLAAENLVEILEGRLSRAKLVVSPEMPPRRRASAS